MAARVHSSPLIAPGSPPLLLYNNGAAKLTFFSNEVPQPRKESLFTHILKQETRISHSEKTATWKKVSAMAGSVAHTESTSELGQVFFEEKEGHGEEDKFDWNAQWYPVAITDNLDKRVPTAVRIIGRDLVVWWDRKGQAWQVWDDKCPHRLAPLSEGRVNERGELQCSYHGWCFAPFSGSCTLIPQAPADGNPVWKSQRACAAIYPSVEQEGLIWFWPDTSPEFKNIAASKPPPSIPALADPTFNDELSSRDLPYGYEQLIENLMDPAHVPFAHHGLQGFRSMAKPLNYRVDKIEKSGYTGSAVQGVAVYTAPCMFTLDYQLNSPKVENGDTVRKASKRVVLVFLCIPVSPGKSKVIWSFRKNFTTWITNMIPRWVIHIRQMLVLDSDMYLLHMTERKLAEAGNTNWEKACYVPTTSDAFVIAFRKWLRVYGGGAPDWGGRYAGGGAPDWGGRYAGLPPTPPKEQLMDRYWSHVKICRHCKAAMQYFEGAGVFLQALSVGLAALLGAAAIKPIPQLRSWSIPLVIVAVISSLASSWLSHFVKKTYHFHDYNHALVK